ncbi:MAG TPA: radical SAM protein [Elusimicrobiota bacterium]|jgi:MoaA/NifB/PqqE/SkfB family radical SAM enzyme|nr:radical SAM protein [Elusimicrobiota bacterium]
MNVPVYVVRLMKRCNSRCEFCSSEAEMAAARARPDVPLADVRNDILSQPPGSIIDFFGGEPTLYPGIVEAVEFASRNGYRPTIASNGRRFAGKAFTTDMARAGLTLVHSTLLGDTAALHNALSVGGRNSFRETVDGFKNILARGIRLQVNIVILRENFRRLARMTSRLLDLGVRDVKFGSLLAAGNYPHLAARISETRPFLAEAVAVARARGSRFSIEKTPICMLPEAADHFQPENDPLADRRSDFGSPECSRCLVQDRCFGVDPGYAALFGRGELKAVTDKRTARLKWPPRRP